jgi:carbon-monoxide dehydrogenase iron sulfur subunit
MEVCPFKAIVRDPKTNAVVIREDLCDGCGACIANCPFKAIFMHPEKNIAIKCDLCGGDPSCVKHCPQSVLYYADVGV